MEVAVVGLWIVARVVVVVSWYSWRGLRSAICVLRRGSRGKRFARVGGTISRGGVYLRLWSCGWWFGLLTV